MAPKTDFVAFEVAATISLIACIWLRISAAVPIYDVDKNKWHTDEIVKALTTAPGNDLAYGSWEGATVKFEASIDGVTDTLDPHQTYYGTGSRLIEIPNVSFEIRGVISENHKRRIGIDKRTEAECALVKTGKKYQEGPTKGKLSIYFHHLNTRSAMCGITGQPKLDKTSTQVWITDCKAKESLSDYLLGALGYLVSQLCAEKVIKPFNDDAIKKQTQ